MEVPDQKLTTSLKLSSNDTKFGCSFIAESDESASNSKEATDDKLKRYIARAQNDYVVESLDSINDKLFWISVLLGIIALFVLIIVLWLLGLVRPL